MLHTYACCVWIGVHTYICTYISNPGAYVYVLDIPSYVRTYVVLHVFVCVHPPCTYACTVPTVPSPSHTLLYTLLHFLPSGTRSTLTSLQWGVADVSSFFYFMHIHNWVVMVCMSPMATTLPPVQDDHVGDSSDALIHMPCN